jgi:RIO kinase 2
MIRVQDMPESEDEQDEDEADEEEEEEEHADADRGNANRTSTRQRGTSEPVLDEVALRTQMEERFEALRHARALGNDDDSRVGGEEGDLGASGMASLSLFPARRATAAGATGIFGTDSDSESDSDAESSSSGSALSKASIAQTDYTSYLRPEKPRPVRINARKLAKDRPDDAVALRVKDELTKARRGGGGKKDTGRAKGHKWKTSEKYLVGKTAGW